MTLAKMGIFILADGVDQSDGRPLVRIEGEPRSSKASLGWRMDLLIFLPVRDSKNGASGSGSSSIWICLARKMWRIY